MKKFIEIVEFVIEIMLVMAAAYLVSKIKQLLGIPVLFQGKS